MTIPPSATSPPVEDPWGVVTFGPGEPVILGVAGPFSGDSIGLGEAILRGVELAMQEQPEIAGFPIQLVKIDDAENSTAAAENAVSDPHLVAVIGHALSSTNREVIPIYEQKGVIMVSATANFADLTDPGSPVFNRVSFNAAFEGREAAEYLFDRRGFKTLAVIYADSQLDQGIAAAAEAHFAALGGSLLLTGPYPPATTDFSTLLASLKDVAPEAVFLAGSAGEAEVFLKQALDSGLLEGSFLLAADRISYSDPFRELAPQAPGGPGDRVAVLRVDDLPDSEELNAFTQAQGLDLSSDDRSVPFAYDAARMILSALSSVSVAAGSGELFVGRKALADAIRSTAEFSGLTGSLACDEHGDCGAGSVDVLVAEGGGWVPPPGEVLAEVIEAGELIEVEQVDLQSAAGRLAQDGQNYDFLAAATFHQEGDPTIGVLYISDSAAAIYSPGSYRMQLIDASQESPQLLLISETGEQVEPVGEAAQTREEIGNITHMIWPRDKSRFLFLEGSVRCVNCPWWLLGLCYCITCQ